MKTIALEENPLNAVELAALARKQTVVLTRRGKPVATVKDVSGVDLNSLALAENVRFQAILRRSRREFQGAGGIPLSEVRNELGLEPPRSNGKKRKSVRRRN